MIIRKNVYELLIQAFCFADSEIGGMLGKSENEIVSFYFDKSGIGESDYYIPDVQTLNRVLEFWNKQDIFFAGLVHTHEKNKHLSIADVCYGDKIAKAFKRTIILGVFVLESKELFLYKIDRKNGIRHVNQLVYQIGE